jgi:hypothetical protein
MVSTALRGRAASVVRVGKLIKDVLNGRLASEDGTFVTEAAVVDIHHVYKREVREQNLLRRTKLKPMVYSSFVCQFRFAEQLKLVELVRKEDMLFPPPNGNLYTFKVHDGNIGELSKRHIYRLTDVGRQDELSWTNLTQAYLQHWIAPQVAPEQAVKKKPYKYSNIPSLYQLIDFANFLKTNKLTSKEYDSYSMKVGDWAVYYEDRAKISKTADDKYSKLAELVNELYNRLAANDSPGAIMVLTEMIKIMSSIYEGPMGRPRSEEEKSRKEYKKKESVANIAESEEKLAEALEELEQDNETEESEQDNETEESEQDEEEY